MIDLETLNGPQREAVLHTEGPLLILAGAGSGKTKALTTRVAHLIKDLNVDPYNIMAITFTNKAAAEMKTRIEDMIGAAPGLWVSTFHSACVRILRRYVDRMGIYDNHFSIYDVDDAKGVIKAICKDKSLNTKELKESAIYSAISSAKNRFITPDMYLKQAHYEDQKIIAEVYAEYEKRLIKNNAFDFDDILLRAVQLLKKDPEVLDYYQERLKYIHVDEYQDTNGVQFMLIELLSGKYRNLCVVGDDDQSIYKFRGADITNILSFENVFPNAKVIRLEQNYRSAQNILSAANSVIANNRDRKKKTLWTDKGDGDLLRLRQMENAQEEGEFIIDDIRRRVRSGDASYRDHAVLYRTNAQSRILEEKCVERGIPYQIVGGVNFYSRKEIKDILAYLKTIDNGADDVALKRIINVPKRGIGATTIARVSEYALDHNISMYNALKASDNIAELSKASSKLKKFVLMIEAFRAGVPMRSVKEIIENVLEVTGYIKEIEEEEEKARADERKDNIKELISKAASYDEKEGKDAGLGRFLEQVALVADIDEADMGADRIMLMTLHGAKGLEFPIVYLSGMEDGLFPGFNTIMSGDRSDMEEERRLAYVGITRAMNSLTLTCARERMHNGQTRYNSPSRFVLELPEDLLEPEGRNLLKHMKDIKHRMDASRSDMSGGSFKETYKGSISSFNSSGSSYGEERPTIKTLPRVKARLGTPSENKPYISKKLGDTVGIKKGAPVMTSKPDYDAGDRVRHVKYGEGTVLSVEEAPKDYRVSVDFDNGGKKIMLAAFAKLQKI